MAERIQEAFDKLHKNIMTLEKLLTEPQSVPEPPVTKSVIGSSFGPQPTPREHPASGMMAVQSAEPKPEWLEVQTGGQQLGCMVPRRDETDQLVYEWHPIHELPSLAGFDMFVLSTDGMDIRVTPDEVAHLVRSGRKVWAVMEASK